MIKSEAKNKILKVIEKIQLQLAPEEGAAVPLTGSTIPAKEIEKFDSKIWPLAKARICRELDVEIPKREKLFADRCTPLTIDEVVARVCVLSAKQGARKKRDAAA